MMQGMTFSTPKASLEMEDIARGVEENIEKLFQELFSSQWPGVQIQLQIGGIMDWASARDFGRKDEVNRHLKSGDTVVMEVNAVPSFKQGARGQQQPDLTDEMIEKVRSSLRFGLNDRVLCWCGHRHLAGHIVSTAVPDLATKVVFPYLVKIDALPELPSRTISVPKDKDCCCMQEVCFDPATQLDLVRCAASAMIETRKPKLRFALGDRVVCRIQNSREDGLENWVTGFIKEIWPQLGEATWDLGEASGKFPEVVPYKIELALGKFIYCHRDEHTLIRRDGMQPVTRVRGMSKRIEHVTGADGGKFCIDHVTGRRKRELEEVCDSDSDHSFEESL